MSGLQRCDGETHPGALIFSLTNVAMTALTNLICTFTELCRTQPAVTMAAMGGICTSGHKRTGNKNCKVCFRVNVSRRSRLRFGKVLEKRFVTRIESVTPLKWCFETSREDISDAFSQGNEPTYGDNDFLRSSGLLWPFCGWALLPRGGCLFECSACGEASFASLSSVIRLLFKLQIRNSCFIFMQILQSCSLQLKHLKDNLEVG